MPTSLTPVHPGDLVSAVWMNQLVSTVEALDARVEALEGKGSAQAPVITGFVPTGEVPLPARLSIKGHNFLVPVSGNTVLIDGQPFTDFKPGSDDETLIVDIPSSFGILPREATVTVVNRNGSDSRRVQLKEAVIVPDGRMEVRNTTAALPPPIFLQTYTYTFELRSVTNIAETYALELRFRNVDGATTNAWLTGSGIEGPTQRTLQPDQPETVSVRITVPMFAHRAEFVLFAHSLHNPAQLDKSSDPVPIEVGLAQDPLDPSIKFKLKPPGPASAAQLVDIDGAQGLQVPAGQQVQVRLTLTVDNAGQYRLETKSLPDNAISASASPADGARSAGDNDVTLRITKATPGAATLRVDAIQHDGGNHRSYTLIPIRGV